MVDVGFADHLPPIHHILHAGDDGQIVIQVLAHKDAQTVSGIAPTTTEGLLAPGTAVRDDGGP